MKNYNKTKNVSSQSKNQHSFAVVEPGVSRERSTIDRPSRTITAIDAGQLYPIIVDEVLPGDTFQLSLQLQGWLATPIAPFLDNLYVDTFFFFVPNRLVWENWQHFQGEKDDPGDTTTYVVPQISIEGGAATGANKLADYMGIPTNVADFKVNAMPFRGYNLIYNEYFRDTNLQDSTPRDRGDADSLESDHILKRRGKRKDYLTGCLPWPQRGDAVELPLGTTAPVVGAGNAVPDFVANGLSTVVTLGGEVATDHVLTIPHSGAGSDLALIWNDPKLEADLSSATTITVNALRESIAIQHLLELDARGGTRYTEQLKARFGVTSSDQRLQRPEYLGGGHQNVSVHPVPGTNQAQPSVGGLGGFGNINGSGGGFTHSFTEHGYVIGLVSLRSDYTYFEGIPRHWRRESRYDYYEPALAGLGEQAVLNSEIFVSNTAVDDQTFGFQERFSEYKYGNSMVTSLMRPNHQFPLDWWHLAEKFGTLPTLGDVFIQENPPIDRIIAVTSEPHLLMDCYFTNKTTRVMPVFNTPGLSRL